MMAIMDLLAIVNALGIPSGARVDSRISKKLLIEQGARTAADKRAIQEGIDELQWFAACKPTTIGIPAFSDDTREYLEVAVVGCAFRAGAKASRLIELIHRAIPYPVLLITSDESDLSISAAHKRHAQKEADRTVIEQVIAANGLRSDAVDPVQAMFLKSLALAQQPHADLFTFYTSWIARIEAINAARLTGVFVATNDQEAIDRRSAALDAHVRLTKEIEGLHAQAKREKQLNRRVDLNLEIQRRKTDLAAYVNQL